MNNEYENLKQSLEEDWAIGEPNFHSNQAVNLKIGEFQPVAGSQSSTNGEDWAMNDAAAAEDDLNASAVADSAKSAGVPNTNPLTMENSVKWQMPEPVYRVSKGKKFDKTSSSPPVHPNSSAAPPEVLEVVSSPMPIQPQPDIAEEITIGNSAVSEELETKIESKTNRMIFIVAGIAAMILFAVGFLVGIYFLFIHTPK